MAEAVGERRLPLTILGGFLGAGKSSWARHQLHEGRFARHYVIVNEAAGTPVDNLLLTGARYLSVLSGGCACCDGLPDLIATLRDICDQATGARAGEIDGILMETSGLADPGKIAVAIAGDPVLSRRLILEKTIVLVDALHGLTQLHSEPLAHAQIEAADELILSKPATAPVRETAELLAVLRWLNPSASITGAELGQAVALPPPGRLREIATPETSAPIRPFRLEIGAAGWVGLSTWLSALLQARGQDVVRVKGVVRTPAGRLLLQSVRRVVQPPEILPEAANEDSAGLAPEDGVIVLIGRNFDAETLQRSWELYGA